MRESTARERFASARVARLATVTTDGAPHLVPVVFVVRAEAGADVVWMAVDEKPKSTRRLKRLANVASEPRVSLLVDHYDEDWSSLWWARADGRATVVTAESPEAAGVLDALVAKYPQDAGAVHLGPLLRVTVERWVGWAADDEAQEARESPVSGRSPENT